MQEFLSFGRSNGLIRFNETIQNGTDVMLVDAINNISDSILLNRMNNFSMNLKNLSETLKQNELQGFYGIVKGLVSNNYKVQIKNRTYDLLGRDSDYLPAQLKWCLDKKLYSKL